MSLPRLVLYARTSTDDNQSPEDSKRWQISLGTTVVAGRGEIVDVVHDTDVSRALPWDRRPQASPADGRDGRPRPGLGRHRDRRTATGVRQCRPVPDRRRRHGVPRRQPVGARSRRPGRLHLRSARHRAQHIRHHEQRRAHPAQEACAGRHDRHGRHRPFPWRPPSFRLPTRPHRCRPPQPRQGPLGRPAPAARTPPRTRPRHTPDIRLAARRRRLPHHRRPPRYRWHPLPLRVRPRPEPAPPPNRMGRRRPASHLRQPPLHGNRNLGPGTKNRSPHRPDQPRRRTHHPPTPAQRQRLGHSPRRHPRHRHPRNVGSRPGDRPYQYQTPRRSSRSNGPTRCEVS